MRFLLFLLVILSWQLSAQNFDEEKIELGFAYIEKHKQLAIDEMQKFGIPASITLAQALHESDYGRSRLAKLANNHFGAKSHNTWKGASILHDDDAPKEKFRKYKNVAQSYQDHSMVLMKQRYNFLFNLNEKDYVSWAHGLKKAGYATDPSYAYKLIKIIEFFNLTQYDYDEKVVVAEIKTYSTKAKKLKKRNNWISEPVDALACNYIDCFKESPIEIEKRKVVNFVEVEPQWINGCKALVFPHNVKPSDVVLHYKVDKGELLANNYLNEDNDIKAGTPIYLEKLRPKLNSFNNDYHLTKRGETLRDIAILYGIQLEKLEKLNKIDAYKPISANQQIGIRKKNKSKVEFLSKPKLVNKIPLKIVNKVKENFEVKVGISSKRTIVKLPDSYYRNSHDEQIPVAMVEKVEESELVSLEEIVPETYLEPQPFYHKVSPGETLYRLSVIYNTDVDTLKTLNKLEGNTIQIGRVVRVR